MAKIPGNGPSAGRVAAPRARDTPPGVPFDGVLFIDMEHVRAKYECLRPGCPHRLEGPVHSYDLIPGDKKRRTVGAGAVKAFIDGIKSQHLAQYHGSPR
ncbi:hypothetical protein [Streptomyces luteocolor]|uniref:hypothetical protein n=1 Tax=Streptomyces luteocolor TaxID=285500 RepID=UPI00114D2437|nr:hypothetical protein [Streptomyces luteocolor]